MFDDENGAFSPNLEEDNAKEVKHQEYIRKSPKEKIIQELLDELDGGDYVKCLERWDEYVVQSPIVLTAASPELLESASKAEFLFNLICATSSFR